ncbi:3,4-dihydroxy-2-butanone-4-phosphate synthase [Elizabethkingia sp. HX WHF]|uniref:3,4-dihydroxy-2-butanone 4-phosphate synthase n=1 Tax=Elizabethkingia bruuniana TaxID=1756149 RepID=A0A7T8A023_9FLAO|nr:MULTISPECIES: 3,4-dihydroxy-2-butanone-4-phosphate synthase [Elizabethkingia]ATL44903.1 3,4-dihydroxy-2-butanone-4-phosphate synthase [Elizabethkingia miricola]AQX86247.1 3,4-dihydroxy-2-butanone 4-phosphate synthase [Elizabethkingia bruuniana]KGO10341.1 3,4-dihydroxy-2-butanone 4-phosphate synthase [Elizabethkingia miricola]KUY24759.1 3,4-dihydroxy-2-butanone 4-phosphate synthase [Elizabethkingia bruuniana]MCL1636657.1 3,4-dihydroxy-2-butanone-4-phosphate synthase [Elizabethkingia bruunian
MDRIQLDTIPEAIEHLRQGKMIVVVDDEDRENEGDLIGAADLVTPEMINFMTVHARGLVCVPLPEKRCDELGLDIMVSRSSDPKETAFTVSIDLLGNGNSTGISAGDRSRTIQAMMNLNTKPTDFMRPGHIFPLRAKEGGVLKRAGHTEASIDLTRLAGLNEGGVICEIMNEDGSMARLPELKKFSEKHDLKIVSIEDLIQYRMKQGDLVERIEEQAIQTHFGDFNFYAYKERHTDQIHYAITKGKWADKEPVLIRVQSSSAYFDIFTRLANGEKPLMEKAIQMINAEGKGAIVFINNVSDSEKTMNKLQQFLAYQSGTQGKPTIRANYKDYGIGIQILKDLGINNLKVLTQSPDQRPIVSGYDVEVSELVELTV